MKLLTKEIIKKIPKLYATDGQEKRDIPVKFFTPWSNWTWYVFEGEQKEDGDWEFFGLVEGIATEMGYFYLSELEAIKGLGGLRVERDMGYRGYYDLKTFKVVRGRRTESACDHEAELG